MRRFGVSLIAIAASVTLMSVFAASVLQAQTHRTKIEIKGVVSQIDPNAGSFSMESLSVTTTPATRYEDMQDRRVNKQEFFSKLRANDRVEVEGILKGNVLTAHEIEMKHP